VVRRIDVEKTKSLAANPHFFGRLIMILAHFSDKDPHHRKWVHLFSFIKAVVAERLMQTEPKRSRKHAFLYLILGIILGLIVLGIASAIGLFTQNMIFTFDNIVSLHTSYPLFLVIDGLILFSIFLLFWVGREKDRVEYSKKHTECTQNHQLGLNSSKLNRIKRMRHTSSAPNGAGSKAPG
jgi:hypothetical protein